jgi:hypothetical protein
VPRRRVVGPPTPERTLGSLGHVPLSQAVGSPPSAEMKTRRRSPPASSRYWVTAAWCSATTDEVVSMERRQRPFGRIRSCPPRSHATASVRRGRARHARFSGERSSRSDRQPAATRFRVRPDAIAPVAAGLGCVSAWSRPAPTCAFTQVGSYGSLLRSREGERRTSRRVIAGCSEIADCGAGGYGLSGVVVPRQIGGPARQRTAPDVALSRSKRTPPVGR